MSTCKRCGDPLEGDGYKVVLHCPNALNYESLGLAPDAEAVLCGPTPSTVAKVVQDIKRAAAINEEMQNKCAIGSAQWHRHEDLDDVLFEALGALGD